MRLGFVFCLLLPLNAAAFVFADEETATKKPADVRDKQLKVGGVKVTTILKRLGAKLERGVTDKQRASYLRVFGFADHNGDGRHSKREFIDEGNYLTPRARRGIFNAADSDKDGFVTKAEYVLNRIITDEGKAIIGAMDGDKNGVVERNEFVKTATTKLSDVKLARQVFAALDTNGDGKIPVPEYLRVWGKWARIRPAPKKKPK